MTTWTLPNGDIVHHGDEIEFINKRTWESTVRGRKMTAYVSSRYPHIGNIVSFQIEGYRYNFDDVHTTTVKEIRLVHPELKYDPTQQGDTDEDI